MNLKCILHHLIKHFESYRQGMTKFQLQNHQIDPLKSKTSHYLVIPSSEWCQMTCMVIYVWFDEYIMLFRQFRFKVWGEKNGRRIWNNINWIIWNTLPAISTEISSLRSKKWHFSLKLIKMTPWENENTLFHLISSSIWL